MKELRYHIYVNNECVSHSLCEDNFTDLFDYYNDMSDHVTYEVVEVPQYQEASY
jgi:ferredoxin